MAVEQAEARSTVQREIEPQFSPNTYNNDRVEDWLADNMSTLCVNENKELARPVFKAQREIFRIMNVDDEDEVNRALKVMELPDDFTMKQLKDSFVEFARLLHPDKCKFTGADKAFKIVQERSVILF